MRTSKKVNADFFELVSTTPTFRPKQIYWVFRHISNPSVVEIVGYFQETDKHGIESVHFKGEECLKKILRDNGLLDIGKMHDIRNAQWYKEYDKRVQDSQSGLKISKRGTTNTNSDD